MKTVIVALTVLTLVAAQASAAQAARRRARGNAAAPAAEQSGTYHGYPLSDWYRTDTW